MSQTETALQERVPEQVEVTGSERARRLRAVRSRALVMMTRLFFVVAFLVLWQYADGRWIPDFISSSPERIGARLVQLFTTGSVWPDVWITLMELLVGYALGVAIGFLLGLALGLWGFLGDVFEPILSAVNAVPKIALAPLFLIWIGIGVWSKIAIAAMTVAFVMFYSTFVGAKTVPKNLVDVLRVMGARQRTIVRRVVVPSIMGPIVTGLKTSVPFAMIGVIVGEFIAADRGVGYFIRQATEQYDSASMFAGVCILLVMVLAGNGLLGVLQRRLFAWRDA